MSNEHNTASLLTPKLKLFMLAMVLANVAGNMYGSLLPLYLKELHASVVQIGLFYTISRVIPLALQILGGWVSDTIGRLRSVALGSLAGMLAYVALILAPTWQWVLLSEGLGAITRSLIGPSFSAFVAEQSSESTRARVYGLTNTIFMVVNVVGPPLGGLLAGAYGFRVMLICAAALYALATVIRVSMARAAARGAERNPRPFSLRLLGRDLRRILALVAGGGVLTWLVLTDGVRDIAFSMSFTLESIYLEEVGGLTVAQIGLLGSVFGVFTMLTTIPGGWLADRHGERVPIVAGFVLDAVAIAVLLRAQTFWGYALSWALFGLGVGLMSPAYDSLISKAVPASLRGTAFGLLSTSLGVFSLPAPAIGAQLWQRFSPQLPFALTGWVALITAIPAWFKFKIDPRNATESDLTAQPQLETE